MADGTDEVAEVTTHPQTPLRTNRPLIQAQLTVRHTRPAYIQDLLTYPTIRANSTSSAGLHMFRIFNKPPFSDPAS